MRLGVRTGLACEKILDATMRGLNCSQIEVDELWGFIGKKQAHTSQIDRRAGLGDVWTFLSIDPETKLMPSFLVGKRDHFHAVQERRKYSPARLTAVFKTAIVGDPNPSKVCTSYIERANLTVRTHCKRLARLTLAFSKKLENFKAAIALHLAYYNFVKIHGSLRCTPAMEAGVSDHVWSLDEITNLI